ncbi:unnamed protein product, partial [Mesorhabditis belari]|uniref:Uncharacterized protein n=1 Tax=Mesorhabditis belari TaxID=2138241 RepID=A0AAF3FR03_9BILA
MLLECYNRDISHGIPVNVEAGFEDVLILGRFVEKLASIAGYQQVRVDEDNLSANTSCGSEYEDEIDGEIDCLCWQSKAKKVNLHRTRPILMFVEDKVLPLGFSFPGGSAGYFEITQTPGDTHYRFAYMPGLNRKYELEPEDFDRRATRRATYLMHNVMLQSPPKPNNQRVFKLRNGRRRVAVSPFVNLAEVDVFVDLGVFSDDVFRGGIRKDNFTPI